MKQRAFKQVDVFTKIPFKGNPVAVVLEAEWLTSEQMQSIANWTNLSETTFVLSAQSSQADYQVRIFTPKGELPFAGHPTVGTAFALLESNLISPKNGKVIQECKAGLIELSVTQAGQTVERIDFELPKETATALNVEEAKILQSILGCQFQATQPATIIDVGPRWVVAEISNPEQLLAITPDFTRLFEFETQHQVTGVCLFAQYPLGAETAIEVRTFAPSCGVNEDPVCGSGNGAVAAYLRQYPDFSVKELSSHQGRVVGRDGELVLSIEQDRILVGGAAVTCIEGKLSTQ